MNEKCDFCKKICKNVVSHERLCIENPNRVILGLKRKRFSRKELKCDICNIFTTYNYISLGRHRTKCDGTGEVIRIYKAYEEKTKR